MNTKELEKWIQSVDTKLDNHLHQVTADIAQIKTDMDWVKRFFWLVASISVTSIFGVLFGLILK